MSLDQTKMIRITSKGIVTTSRGRVVSPLRLYRENVDTIFKMLTSSPTPVIYERLANGREIRLTLQNYDKDNELVKPDVSAPTVGSVNNAEKVDDSVKSEIIGQQPQQSNNQQYGGSRKNRKRNKNKGGNIGQIEQQQEQEKNDEILEEFLDDGQPSEKVQDTQLGLPLTDDTEQV